MAFRADEQWLADYQRRGGKLPESKKAAPPKSIYKSKAEAKYAGILELQKRAAAIRDYSYESIRIKLGPKLWYTPDFSVELLDGTLELHEVKGQYIRPKGLVKFKAAIEVWGGQFNFKMFEVTAGYCKQIRKDLTE